VTELTNLIPVLGPQVAALLALITVQVLLAVALAIREKKFEWQRLADFYRSMVVPMLIGWLAFAVLAKFASPAVLGPEYGPLAADGVTWLAWLAVVAALGGKIVTTAKSLYGNRLPFTPPDDPNPVDTSPDAQS
jgi:hypothetical protein